MTIYLEHRKITITCKPWNFVCIENQN